MLPVGTTADRISELNRAITVTNRKAPAFLQGLLSLVRYGAEDEVRTRDPLLGNSITTVSQRLRMTIALSLIGT
jgi:hypothetical protein